MPAGPEGSLGKLLWTEGMNLASDVVSHVLGPRLVADTGEWGTYAWAEHVLGSPGYRIAGGSDETQRNIIGERVHPPRDVYDALVSAGEIIDWASFGAVLFDLDGVVTPTAEIHEQAWAELFAPWGFDGSDYLTYVDGRPRYEGVRLFLASRGVELPWGSPSDLPGDNTICALGNRKDAMFNGVLARDGVAPYPGTMRVMDVLDRAGVPSAIVSSSKNAGPVLRAAGIAQRFIIVVDGIVAIERQLPGKPDPATFLYAAECVGVTPAQAAVVEDASSGVAAGRAGDFALVLGVDRGGNREALVAAGADMVVDDLEATLP